MHYSFWNLDEDLFGDCTVVGYAGTHRFSAGHTAPHAYIIEHEGNHYAAPHNIVRDALTNDLLRRRLQGAPAPRVIAPAVGTAIQAPAAVTTQQL